MGLLDGVKSIDFENESYPTYHEFVFLPVFAVFFPIVRYFLDIYVFEGIGNRLIFGKDQQKLDIGTEERNKKIQKFKESAWKCPGTQRWPDQKAKLKLKGLYMYTAGFYMYSIFALIFWETRRSDFGVSMGHHVATLVLITTSYVTRFVRIGSVVLALHDASDVFLEVGKMSKYSGAEGLASCSFILFVLVWILLRLIYYPFWILRSTRLDNI
nr:LAG1 longevity assurance homolog 3-like [Tanacetum cinerariifolium]